MGRKNKIKQNTEYIKTMCAKWYIYREKNRRAGWEAIFENNNWGKKGREKNYIKRKNDILG